MIGTVPLLLENACVLRKYGCVAPEEASHSHTSMLAEYRDCSCIDSTRVSLYSNYLLLYPRLVGLRPGRRRTQNEKHGTYGFLQLHSLEHQSARL
jgi:hypothetical protein